MSDILTWVHIGDLHLDEEENRVEHAWESRERLETIVDQINRNIGKGADFVFLPGDNANHGTPEQYRAMIAALQPLDLPWRTIPGDHDFEPGDLQAYHDEIPAENRPEMERFGGHRCLFLDIVSAGSGGPDFRLTMHDRNRIAEQLAHAQAAGEVPAVFMHAYPGDLAADGDTVARAFADGGVAFVDTGHTHYNELLNDGRVIYGATRSTGQIEEGGGRPGYAIVCLHERVPSWRFRDLEAEWPHVQIVAPCDLRLVTRPADPHQVPRPEAVTIVAHVLGDRKGHTPVVKAGHHTKEMSPSGKLWSAELTLAEGLHEVTVRCGAELDTISLLVREGAAIPKRRSPVALGQECHAIGAWPTAGIEGTQLGPNKNGGGW